MPEAAQVAPNVPTNTRIIAGRFMNAAGEVPSIMAAPRIPTIAATIPMAVAAFTLLVIGSGPRIFRASRGQVDETWAAAFKRGAPRWSGALRGPARGCGG